MYWYMNYGMLLDANAVIYQYFLSYNVGWRKWWLRFKPRTSGHKKMVDRAKQEEEKIWRISVNG